eukprot:scaffold144777_cov133-Phaeocystis_antarctica.AAC.1
MLQTFRMVLPAADARELLGVCRETDGAPHGKYAYLRGVSDETEVLHPDLVADFSYGLSADGSYDHEAG